jgi:hypothetical protein
MNLERSNCGHSMGILSGSHHMNSRRRDLTGIQVVFAVSRLDCVEALALTRKPETTHWYCEHVPQNESETAILDGSAMRDGLASYIVLQYSIAVQFTHFVHLLT